MRYRVPYYPVPCGTDSDCEWWNWWWDWYLGEW